MEGRLRRCVWPPAVGVLAAPWKGKERCDQLWGLKKPEGEPAVTPSSGCR